MTNPFPSVYYVYKHEDPYTGELLYVGHGKGSRAWTVSVQHRSLEHSEYLEGLLSCGNTPDEWVVIVSKGLTKIQSCEEERKLIKELRPRFNKIHGEKLLKVTPEILEKAMELRNEGWSYQAIADNFDLATMTIHRAVAHKSPALENILERQN